MPLFGRKKDDLATSADWRERVGAPDLTRRALTEIVAELVRARGIAVEVVGDLKLRHGRHDESRLDNLWAMCQGASVPQRVALIAQRVASEVDVAMAPATDIGSIRPIIRPERSRCPSSAARFASESLGDQASIACLPAVRLDRFMLAP